MSASDTTVQANVNNYYFKNWADYEANKSSIINNSTIYINDAGSANVILYTDILPTASEASPDFVNYNGSLYQKIINRNPTSYSYEAVGGMATDCYFMEV